MFVCVVEVYIRTTTRQQLIHRVIEEGHLMNMDIKSHFTTTLEYSLAIYQNNYHLSF